MVEFLIEKGSSRPSVSTRARWALERGVITRKKSARWTMLFPEYPGEDCHVKLLGLHDVTYRTERIDCRYLRNLERGMSEEKAKEDALDQLLSMTHENSLRTIAYFREWGVTVSSYLYVRGKGPATIPHPFDHAWVLSVPYGVEAEIEISEGLYRGVEGGPAGATSRAYPVRFESWFRGFSGAHADNGPSSPVAPVDIRFFLGAEK